MLKRSMRASCLYVENSRPAAESVGAGFQNSKQKGKKRAVALSLGTTSSHAKYSCHLCDSFSCSLVCCNSVSNERFAGRSPLVGRNLENSPIASASSANFLPSKAAPTTTFERPVRREISNWQQASANEDSDTSPRFATPLIRALVSAEISTGSLSG